MIISLGSWLLIYKWWELQKLMIFLYIIKIIHINISSFVSIQSQVKEKKYHLNHLFLKLSTLKFLIPAGG